MLEDGRYDAVVVDAEESDDGALHLELTIVAGPHKGDVVRVVASGMAATGVAATDPIEVLGLPATITVHDGAPEVTLER